MQAELSLMYTPLSVYILTCNSPKYLARILQQLTKVADEILIIDSGSTDNTLQIAESFSCKIIQQHLHTFREQRAFALSQCTHNWVLSFDSDEIPSNELVETIVSMKQTGFTFDAYSICRKWNVLGKDVHVMFPIVSPDYPIRLFNRTICCFDERSTQLHETAHGYKTLGKINAPMFHFTFETKEVLEGKLQRYASIGALDLLEQKRSIGFAKILFSPLAAFIKWYFIKGGWKDGLTGITLGVYAMRYTFLKYKMARNS